MSNIPPPDYRRKYRWKELEVGGSFEFERDAPQPHVQAFMAGKRHGRKYVARKRPDGIVVCYRES